MRVVFGVLCCGLLSTSALADVTGASPRNFVGELKFSSWKPLIDREFPSTKPYERVFGTDGMLRADFELDYQLFQAFGSASIAGSLGYGEKTGFAVLPDSSTPTSTDATIRFLPLKLLAAYRFDYLLQRWRIPLVPYVKGGLVMVQWWSVKGGSLESSGVRENNGREFGYSLVGGLSLCLDFLDQRMARDFDTGLGVNHSYLFAEFAYDQVNNFGVRPGVNASKKPDLSSRFFSFGLALEF